MDRETAIHKIKKCLSLGRSANEHEAAAAMRQAQKLMAQFGVSDVDVQLADVKEADAPVRSEALPSWEVSLARAVAEAFGCSMIVQTGYRLTFGGRRKRSVFVFYGVGQAAQIAAYAHDVLARQCAKARLAHIAAQPKRCKQITKTARGDAFAVSWVVAVLGMLDAFANGQKSKLLLESYKAQRWPACESFKPKARELGRNVKDDSYAAGHQAGSKARLERGLAGREGQELLR